MHNILVMLAENSDTHFIRHNKFLPLPLYLDADDHNINDLKVCILKCNFKDTIHRKLTELPFIINFKTKTFGLNKDISFLTRYDTFKHQRYIFPNLFVLFSPLYFSTPTVIATSIVVTLCPTALLSLT